MLTRRHIRIKVLQTIYAFDKAEIDELKKSEKFLVYSMEQMRDLHLVMLGLLVSLRDYAEVHLEKRKKKHLVTQEDLNPNTRFIDNKVLVLLKENTALNTLISERKLDFWQLDDEYISLLHKEVLASEIFEQYMTGPESDFKADKDFVIQLYKQIIAPNDKLYDYFEDKRLTWLDDYPVVNTGIVKLLNQMGPNPSDGKLMPPAFKNKEDLDFGVELFRKVVLHDEKYTKDIIGKTPNWDKDRIADLDMIMIKMGIAEFLHFPSIPVKVTINEYLEIAKEYSTPKSSIFINGILDKLVQQYRDNDSLNKIGRGLR
ncbi:transcription antitermination protein NusB [Gilvibacter sp.]|uniref:transcription antitermination protein NusB n=1 Tax=Gilvibacter sp. TaxID=2729997 RepID=UPI003F4A5551